MKNWRLIRYGLFREIDNINTKRRMPDWFNETTSYLRIQAVRNLSLEEIERAKDWRLYWQDYKDGWREKLWDIKYFFSSGEFWLVLLCVVLTFAVSLAIISLVELMINGQPSNFFLERLN